MNIWKWLFILLLMANAATLAALYFFLSNDYDALDVEEELPEEYSEHLITLENHTVEFLLNTYLQEDAGSNMAVTIDEENIRLMSENEYLNMNFDTIFILEPYVTDSELIFEISDISVGQLPLSEDMLYTLIRTGADLPEGMRFSTESKALVIDKSMFDGYTDFSVDIESIDYQNNAWYFSFENELN
ncbi:DUF2140 family protein [Lacicoccus alkaliphilus]|uniref:Uncharacterized protein YpmS n=1 Tax=Lacicoccus alkaliphilus DSM 16010 TaxID=1123231 RepID=A0A1M7B5M9_9BACL|nr:DUF2140 family protein [Salinicoccus alkaliphilus]SHL50290.1 Uncharacterized protein YpmS [Salinicoccus alkaliphilus DSM 16010]